MRHINHFKSIPFLSTLFIITFIAVNNQKVSTNLKILLWSTPSLSIGTYLAISTGTGYLISYVVTTKLANNNQTLKNDYIKYRKETYKEEPNINPVNKNDLSYDNTLIEREIKDPAPTINASFRVIGKTSKKDLSLKNTHFKEKENLSLNNEYDEQYYEQEPIYNSNAVMNQLGNDWDDDSYLNW